MYKTPVTNENELGQESVVKRKQIFFREARGPSYDRPDVAGFLVIAESRKRIESSLYKTKFFPLFSIANKILFPLKCDKLRKETNKAK